jgi:hypothetical protein
MASQGMHSASRLCRVVRPAWLASVVACAALGLTSGGRPVEAAAVSEAQVKAAFLYKFASFVQWPDTSAGPIMIGVSGDDNFEQIVAHAVLGKSVKGREFRTRRLTTTDDPSDCQVVYLGGSQPRQAAEMLARVQGPVLTVGETVQFLRDGGMVRFYIEDNNIRFQIHQKNAEASGLKISSQLLALAAR